MTGEELLKRPVRELTRDQIISAFAAKDKQWERNRKENASYTKLRQGLINVISDDLGIKGVQNPGNGKMYDSKSNLRKAYKAQGLIEMGSDAKVTERKEIRGDYDCREALSKAIDQTGFMDKLKKEKIFK